MIRIRRPTLRIIRHPLWPTIVIEIGAISSRRGIPEEHLMIRIVMQTLKGDKGASSLLLIILYKKDNQCLGEAATVVASHGCAVLSILY